jgi:hypothetical protein
MIKSLGIIVISSFVVLLSSCSHYTAQAPAGYAEFEEDSDFRALSSNGIVFRVKEVENDPFAELKFWKEALVHRMKASGYIFIKESEIEIQGVKSAQVEWGSFYNKQDYTYMNVLVPSEDFIFVIEVAGESSQFEKDRFKIEAAVQNLKFDK